MLANLLGFKSKFALRNDGTSQHRRTNLLQGRCGFAGYHAFINISTVFKHEAGRPGHLTIYRHFLTCTHLKHVTYLDGRQRDVLRLLATDQMSRLGRQAHELANTAGCAVLGPLFQQPAGENEGDDHHRGIKISVPLNASAAPNALTVKGIERTEDERDARGECHERIHVGRSLQQLLPSRCEEPATAVDEVGQCQQHGHLIGHLDCPQRNPLHRNGHAQHGKKPRQQCLSLQLSVRITFNLFHRPVALYHEVIADGIDFTLHLFE